MAKYSYPRKKKPEGYQNGFSFAYEFHPSFSTFSFSWNRVIFPYTFLFLYIYPFFFPLPPSRAFMIYRKIVEYSPIIRRNYFCFWFLKKPLSILYPSSPKAKCRHEEMRPPYFFLPQENYLLSKYPFFFLFFLWHYHRELYIPLWPKFYDSRNLSPFLSHVKAIERLFFAQPPRGKSIFLLHRSWRIRDSWFNFHKIFPDFYVKHLSIVQQFSNIFYSLNSLFLKSKASLEKTLSPASPLVSKPLQASSTKRDFKRILRKHSQASKLILSIGQEHRLYHQGKGPLPSRKMVHLYPSLIKNSLTPELYLYYRHCLRLTNKNKKKKAK